MRTTVITTVHGRHEHLLTQREGISRARPGPDEHVVVAMGDLTVRDVIAQSSSAVRVLDVTVDDSGELPLAAARNAGANAAIESGAELLVFLDVDCIPGPALFDRYIRAALEPQHREAILCGTVSYLPARLGRGYDLDTLPAASTPHPARPAPPAGDVLIAEDRRLFWSLSFAVTTPTWQRIGGFHQAYVGYGGEDTDFSEQAHAAGVGMRWVGGADAFHQYHPVSNPPTEHLRAILRNAQLFHRRWGWWPMTGWLEAFARRDLIRYDVSQGWHLAIPDPA